MKTNENINSSTEHLNKEGEAAWPIEELQIQSWTDKYYAHTKKTVAEFGDSIVTYALFMRRPVISAPRLALNWLTSVSKERLTNFEIDLKYLSLIHI